jgi:gamma-butyrobetaine dioxygenase
MNSSSCTEPATLAAFSHDERLLHITWSDGHRSTFDSLWLRDNCPEDRDSASGQRLVDIIELPPDPKLRSVRELDDHSLEMSWFDESRSSRFSLDWLRPHCVCGEHDHSTAPASVLWRALDDGISQFCYSDVVSNHVARADWMTSLLRYGIAFLSEVPCDPGKVLSVAALAGYATETNYGRIFDVKSVPNPNHLAYTDAGLGLHTDNPYRDPVPGFQFLHCLQCSDEGGDSLFADGFAVAADLKARDPKAFAILSSTPVRFAFRDSESDLIAERPLIALDHRREIAAVHYNNRAISPLRLPHGQIRPFYRAYRLLSQALQDHRYEMRLRLQPGDLVAFHNHRVLHGRTSFSSRDVRRHLQGCYVSPDGVFSNFAVLQRNRGKILA